MPNGETRSSRLVARARPWIGVAAAGLVFALAFGAFLTVRTVQATFLEDGFYEDALAEDEIYDRVYTELLADPELADTVDDLLADLPVDPSLQVAAVRLVLPPDRLQEVVEALIDEIIAYLRDERDSLGPDASLSELVAEIEAQATAWVQEQLAALPPETIETVDELEAQVRDFAGALAEGEVPDGLPIAEELPVDSAQVTDTIVSAIEGAADPETVELIEAHVAAGDLDGALVVAAAEFLDPHLDENASELRAALDGETDISLFDLFTEASGETGERVLDEFDTVRGVAGWFSPGVGNAALVVMVLALVAVALLARRRGLPAPGAVAAVMLVTGFVALGVVGVAGLLADGPLDEAVQSGVDGWGLPVSLRDMISDLRGTFQGGVFEELRHPVTTLITVGSVVTVAALLVAGRFGDLAERGTRNRAIASAVVVGFVLVAFGTVSFSIRIEPGEPRECNGHEELCDRPYDEVVFAASHNSMSTADRSFIWPEHDLGLGDQLDYGVRVLLIDTHYWESSEEVADYLGTLPPDLRGAADAFLDDRQEEGAFLCHNLCSLGATELEEALGEVKDFLDDNPNEVVTLFVQDDISNEDTEAAFEASGLLEEVYVHDSEGGWPTLGEMIDRDERLVVLAEESGPPPTWYHQGFELVQETPYEFESAEDFSCEPNRGPADADVFLMNHWLEATAASRSDTAEVNTHDVLVERARRCEDERGQRVNYVAVNFYSIGDLLEAVDTLNGVETDYETS